MKNDMLAARPPGEGASGMREKVGAVIAAAGSSRRMGGIDKLFAIIAGQPLLAHTIDVFQKCPAVDHIILVIAAASVAATELISMSRCSTWLSSCPMTPSISRSSISASKPLVNATEACAGFRPAANALGESSGINHSRGIGNLASARLADALELVPVFDEVVITRRRDQSSDAGSRTGAP